MARRIACIICFIEISFFILYYCLTLLVFLTKSTLIGLDNENNLKVFFRSLYHFLCIENFSIRNCETTI